MAIYIRESRKEDDPLRIRAFPTKAMMTCMQQVLYQLTRFLVSTQAWATSSYLTNQYLFLAQDDRN